MERGRVIDSALDDAKRRRREPEPISSRAFSAPIVVGLDLIVGAILGPTLLGLLGLRAVFTIGIPVTAAQRAEGTAFFTAAAIVAAVSAVLALVILVGGFLGARRRGPKAAAVAAVLLGVLGALAHGALAWGLDPDHLCADPALHIAVDGVVADDG